VLVLAILAFVCNTADADVSVLSTPARIRPSRFS